jgi:hypothetical protein
MFNSGLRGNRAPDGYGTVSSQAQFVQSKYPIPNIITFQVCNLGEYTPNGDTAADTAGNQTIVIVGSGFLNGCTLVLDNTTISPVTFLSDDKIAFTSPAKASGTYVIYVSNPNGGTAILAPGLVYSGSPTFTTAAGSIGSYYETQSISNTIIATSDSEITYSISSGSLPSGATFYANGVISGTAPVENNSNTYSFTVQATDAENQDAFRSFSLTINTDVVTWSSPADGTTYTYPATNPISNVTLSATSAAGYNVSYTANALPANVTLTGNVISGTPNTVANTTTLLTATAATTGRSATRTINWVITVANDVYFPYTSLLLSGTAPTNTWVQDASTNKFAVTITGDSRPVGFSPYNTNWGVSFSNGRLYGSSSTALSFGGNSFTVEAWVYMRDRTYNYWIIGGQGGSPQFQWYIAANSGYLVASAAGAFDASASTTAVPLNTWTHVALVRNGSSAIKYFVNGVVSGNPSLSVSFNGSSGTIEIGSTNNTGGVQPFTGSISNIRVVKDTALYTDSFTPSTSPLTAITNTSLLACQNNIFKDNSSNNLSLTASGATITSFGPFTETDTTTGSGYFDGTGDYLVTPSSTSLAPATNTTPFTIECWVYVTASTTLYACIAATNYAYTLGFGSGVGTYDATITPWFGFYNGGWTGVRSTTAITLNAWNHLACTYTGSNVYIYQNGIQRATAGVSDWQINNQATTVVIARRPDGENPFTGYISDARITIGTAVYASVGGNGTTAFTPPSSPLTALANTKYLSLQYRLGENSNRILDTSGNYYLVTRNGNVTQGTFTPFSLTGWSIYLDGSTSFNIPSGLSTAFAGWGGRTRSFDCWIYRVANTTDYSIQNAYAAVAANGRWSIGISGNKLYFGWTTSTGSETSVGTNASIPLGWVHLSVSVNSTNSSSTIIYLGINGTVETFSNNNLSTQTSSYGWNGMFAGTQYKPATFTGYCGAYRWSDNLRYTSNYSVPTAPFTSDGNTLFLFAQSNRFLDQSSNAYSITVASGTPSIQSFSPFSPTNSYSMATVGGSGYFDGTADFLTVAHNASLSISGNTDACIEAFFYVTTSGVNNAICDKSGISGTAYPNYAVGITSANKMNFVLGNAASPGTLVINMSGSATIIPNQWYHVVCTKRYVGGGSVNEYRIILNGVLDAFTTSANPSDTRAGPLYIGRADQSSSTDFDGYISGLRIFNTAIPTAYQTSSTTIGATIYSFPTVPSGPNKDAKLLLGFTNSGIIDTTSKNDFETYGNALITNAQSKWSTTSLYFDGSGDYLVINPTSVTALFQNYAFGTGDFTIEAWVYATAFSLDKVIVSSYGAWAGTVNFYLGTRAGSPNIFIFRAGDSTPITINGNTGIVTNTWYHIAISRSSGTTRMFVDGVVQTTTHTGTVNVSNTTRPLVVGSDDTTPGEYWSGYINDLRLTKGYGRYTSNFTPPSAPFASY